MSDPKEVAEPSWTSFQVKSDPNIVSPALKKSDKSHVGMDRRKALELLVDVG